MKRLSWKHILIHLIAFWLIAFAFQTFAFLTDLKLSELLRHSNNPQEAITNYNYDVASLSSLHFALGLSHTVGLTIAFIMSIVISTKSKLFWINSLIGFIIILILGFLDLLGWNYLKDIFLFPGKAINGHWYYLINGSIMLFIGMGLLLLKNPIDTKKGSGAKENSTTSNIGIRQA